MVLLNASVFYYDYSNLQIESFTASGTVTLENAATAHITGGELEFETAVAENTRLHGGVGKDVGRS